MVNPERHKEARPEDLAKASLVTVTNNIGAIARMCASISVIFVCVSRYPTHTCASWLSNWFCLSVCQSVMK